MATLLANRPSSVDTEGVQPHCVSVVDDGARVLVSGEIDADSADELVRGLEMAAPAVQVDLRDCSFMDSTGVAALVAAKSGRCPGLRVSAASRAVELVLSVTGLTAALCGDDVAERSP